VNEPALEPTTARADGSADASGPAGSATRAARPGAACIVWRGTCVALIVAADLASKAAIFAWLEPLRRSGALAYDAHGHPRYTLAGDWLAFMLSTNPGAAFGQLESFPYLLVGGRIVAAIFLVYLLARSAPGRALFNTALVLVLGGALGNLYDNLFLNLPHEGRPFGPVRDFIDVYFRVWDWHFPTFNVADSCITIGAVLLLLSGLVGERAPKPEPTTPTASTPG
jgi:lipoprotein signal peptidase